MRTSANENLPAGSPLLEDYADTAAGQNGDLVTAGLSIAEALEAGITLRLPTSDLYRPNAPNADNDIIKAMQAEVDSHIGAGVIKVGYDPKAR